MLVHGVTHVGNLRDSNEDAMVWDESLGLVAVADGMGGRLAGEVASRLALEALRGFLARSALTTDFTWPFGIDPRRSLTANRLMTALRIANRRVFKQSEATAEYVGMGTTVVAVVADESVVSVASVGDSRLYMLVDGYLQQVTRDDSWTVMLSATPGVTEETLKRHPLRNVLTNVVGAKLELDFEVQDVVWQGEPLLLSTDGLHTALSNDTMSAILRGTPDVREASEALVRAALAAGSKDDVTAIVARA